MSLLKKIKEIFEAEEQALESIFVKTKDGIIFLVKSAELVEGSEIVSIDEAGVEQAIEDGDYTLEDDKVLTIVAGKIDKIAEVEISEEDVTEVVEEPVEMESTEQVENSNFSTAKFAEVKTAGGDSFFIDGEIAIDSFVYQSHNSIVLIDGKQSTIQYPIWDNIIELEDGTILTIVDGKILEIGQKEEVVDTTVEASETSEVEIENEEFSKVKELEELLKNTEKELELSRLELSKLKSSPASKPIDVRKFEKTEITKNTDSLLNKVSELLNKK